MSRGILICVVTIIAISQVALAAHEVEIPRSVVGDKGRYFLISKTQAGEIVRTLHRRTGPSGTGFTLTEADCKAMKIRELGYGEEGPDKIKPHTTTEWAELVSGSSKGDLANFVCRR